MQLRWLREELLTGRAPVSPSAKPYVNPHSHTHMSFPPSGLDQQNTTEPARFLVTDNTRWMLMAFLLFGCSRYSQADLSLRLSGMSPILRASRSLRPPSRTSHYQRFAASKTRIFPAAGCIVWPSCAEGKRQSSIGSGCSLLIRLDLSSPVHRPGINVTTPCWQSNGYR